MPVQIEILSPFDILGFAEKMLFLAGRRNPKPWSTV
jgi:hypothetical protein